MSKYTDLITNYHAGKPKFFDHVDFQRGHLLMFPLRQPD
ncbi:Uncharacterised protein [Klebsiella pneumoniae]|uniref:Uncharacterized protein n=1 Tax=Klebsiella pneumoniae TaxID=573 RepID=A0A377TQL8_KLEPN|nr:Uncharacterised protein [Klebsiella pneumoniae]